MLFATQPQRYILACLASILLLASQAQAAPKVYKANNIGWEITIPEGWQITSENLLTEREEKGKKALQGVLGDQPVDYEHTPLLNIQKDRFNGLTSTSTLFDGYSEAQYKENSKQVIQLILDTYKSKGIHHTHSVNNERIAGLEFEVLTVHLFSPKKEKILTQKMYSRLFGDIELSVQLYFNSDKTGKELKEIFNSSIFSGLNQSRK